MKPPMIIILLAEAILLHFSYGFHIPSCPTKTQCGGCSSSNLCNGNRKVTLSSLSRGFSRSASSCYFTSKPFIDNQSTTTTSLSLFDFLRRNQEDKNSNDDDGDDKKKTEEPASPSEAVSDTTPTDISSSSTEAETETEGKRRILSRIFDRKKDDDDESSDKDGQEASLSPIEKAKAMKAQAERMRLEAEKMDAQLTLEKIERLESELSSNSTKLNKDEIIKRQLEMETLQAKMRGEAPPLRSAATTVTTAAATTSTSMVESTQAATATVGEEESSSSSSNEKADEVLGSIFGAIETQEKVGTFDTDLFNKKLQAFNNAPKFMKRLMAKMANVDYDEINNINSTAVALWLMDNNDEVLPTPAFTSQQINEMEERILNDPPELYDEVFAGTDSKNTTALAIRLLEKFYNQELVIKQLGGPTPGMNGERIDVIPGIENVEMATAKTTEPSGEGWRSILEGSSGDNEGSRTVEALYPKSCRKEGQAPKEKDVQTLANDILPKASFMPSSKPEPTLGGYIIRGTNKLENGDKLIDSIDDKISTMSPQLRDKLSVFLVKDFTIYGDDDADLTNAPPIIYVTGPNVAPDRRRLLLTLVSSLGVGTAWYESIYPCLLNADIMKRSEEQMALADSGMSYDMSFITDSASPIFATLMGITIAHELGHRAAAGLYGTNITLPTLIPSLVTGLTGSVTTFKSPPKNNQAMFDFAIAGPIIGIIASLGALYLGCELTVTADQATYANYPALPLQILRQSSLGGGIIESILGAGVLNIPSGAEGSQAISSINIPLHPFAVAGFIGLFINALSLVPVGTTDGGRIALTMFGRGLKLLVGQLVLLVCFFVGLTGSDLFLFYFSFLVFFQNGNEIPSRNEYDDVPFSRVLLATAMGVVTLLTLIPM